MPQKRQKRLKKLEFLDLVRTGPDTLAGKYMRRFWHPVHRSQDIEHGHAKPIRIMGENFTLYRGDTGTPHVVAFRCAHRGTQLSAGWVEGDCIRCSYHGWLYDGAGQCLEQPAEDGSFAQKIRIGGYPTREYLEHIFAYFGDGEPPPFPQFPNFEKEGFLEVLPALVWPCNFLQRIDNNGDTVHVPFVHRGMYSASNARTGIPNIAKEESDWGTTAYATFPGGWTNVFQFVMPNAYTFRNPSPDPELPWDDRLQWDVPLDDERSVEFRLRLVPVAGKAQRVYQERRARLIGEDKKTSTELGEAVLSGKIRFQDLGRHLNEPISLVHAQDYVAQVGQGPVADRTQEHLGRSDMGIILFRKIWERELRALAQGRPLKKWGLPQDAGSKFHVGRIQEAPRQ